MIIYCKNLLFLIPLFTLLFGCSSSDDLKWHQEEGYRLAETSVSWFGSTVFKELSSRYTGITFQNKINEDEIAENRHYMNGSGVTAGDIDEDGLADLYFAKLNGPNKLYKNLGNMIFEDGFHRLKKERMEIDQIAPIIWRMYALT